MGNYTARVTREGRWWIIDIPELDVTTQSRRIQDVEQMAAEAVAVMTSQRVADVRITLEVADVDGIAVADEVAAITSARQERDDLERHLADETHSLAQRLAAAGVTVRDIGDLLGVSFQRAHQLVNS
jgi:uncharacterized protein involved in propanediol utilization